MSITLLQLIYTCSFHQNVTGKILKCLPSFGGLRKTKIAIMLFLVYGIGIFSLMCFTNEVFLFSNFFKKMQGLFYLEHYWRQCQFSIRSHKNLVSYNADPQKYMLHILVPEGCSSFRWLQMIVLQSRTLTSLVLT